MMENKGSFCRNCGAHLENNTKVCPQCGVKNTNAKRPIYKKWWFWVIIVVIVLAAIGTGSSGPKKVGQNEPVNDSNMAQPNTPDNGNSNTVSSGENKFYVGDKVELNDIVVSLNAVTENSGSAYNKPGDGNVFCALLFFD